MTTLVFIAASVIGVVLIMTAMANIARTTPVESGGRGPWGILEISFDRDSDLDAQQRRWQTSLVAASRQRGRWSDLVAGIEGLGEPLDLQSDPTPPDRFDTTWIDRRLMLVEDALDPDRRES